MKIIFTSILMLIAAQAYAADDFAQASNALCNKMKSCALEEMGNSSDIPPETKAMMTQMLDGMCAQMQSSYSAAVAEHALYEPALACMSSMAKQSCAQLDQGNQTPECVKFDNLSNKY